MDWSNYSLIMHLLAAHETKVINDALIACRHIPNHINKNYCISREIFNIRDAEIKRLNECKADLLEAVQAIIKNKHPKNKGMQKFWCIPDTKK